MQVETVSYKNEKKRAKREYKVKEELTAFERNLSQLLKYMELAVYLLAIIAMVLLGLFVRVVLGGWLS